MRVDLALAHPADSPDEIVHKAGIITTKPLSVPEVPFITQAKRDGRSKVRRNALFKMLKTLKISTGGQMNNHATATQKAQIHTLFRVKTRKQLSAAQAKEEIEKAKDNNEFTARRRLADDRKLAKEVGISLADLWGERGKV